MGLDGEKSWPLTQVVIWTTRAASLLSDITNLYVILVLSNNSLDSPPLLGYLQVSFLPKFCRVHIHP